MFFRAVLEDAMEESEFRVECSVVCIMGGLLSREEKCAKAACGII